MGKLEGEYSVLEKEWNSLSQSEVLAHLLT